MADLSSPLIHSYADGGFLIGEEFHQGSILILGQDLTGFEIRPWKATTADDISPASLEAIYQSTHRPDLILIGVGGEMSHPFAKLRSDLGREAIKVEIQPTSAACRTWNLLLSEGRKVALAALAE